MIDIHIFEPLWGAWKIDKLLGSGSYGSVYKAVRREYGQEYWAAIKHVSIPMSEAELQTVYDEGLASDECSARMYYEQLLDNLQEEIQFMCRLKGNTNIVAYEDHLTIPKQEMPGYDIFIRMELLRGLNDIIRTNQLTTAEVCRLGIDICKALELLEREGIVHRDIKPANILRNSMGNYKLGDFGVAKQLEHTHTIMSKKGTYTYMAPEVFKGETASARADIYSLGLVMHRLLNNNKAPFIPVDATHISHTQSEEALMRRMKGAVLPAPVMADAALAEIIGIACAYKPEERFQTAEAFRMALEGYYKNELCSEPPVIVDIPDMPEESGDSENEPYGETGGNDSEDEKTRKLFGGDTTKGGTKPEPVPEPEREYHSDEDGETEADEPVDKPSSLVKRILIGAAAVAAVGLIFAFPKEREVNAGEENTVVHLDVAESEALVTPMPAEKTELSIYDKLAAEDLTNIGLMAMDTIEDWMGVRWPVQAKVLKTKFDGGIPIYNTIPEEDTEADLNVTNGTELYVLGAYFTVDGESISKTNEFYRVAYTNAGGNVGTGYIKWSDFHDALIWYENTHKSGNMYSLDTREGASIDLEETFSKAEYTIVYVAHTACEEEKKCATVTCLKKLMSAKEKYEDSIFQIINVMFSFDNTYEGIDKQIEYVGEDVQHAVYSLEKHDGSGSFIYGAPDTYIFDRNGCLVSNMLIGGFTEEEDYSELLSALAEQTARKKAQYIGRAIANGVNVRAEASTNAELIGILDIYDKAYINNFVDENGWYEIIYNGRIAYVSSQYIQMVTSIDKYNPCKITIMEKDINYEFGLEVLTIDVTKDIDIDIKVAPASETFVKVPHMTEVLYLGDVGNGYGRIEYDGKILYVSSDYLMYVRYR